MNIDHVKEFHASLKHIEQIISLLQKEEWYEDLKSLKSFAKKIRVYIESIFVLDNTDRYFHREIYPELDKLEDKVLQASIGFEKIQYYFDGIMKEEEAKLNARKKKSVKSAKPSSKVKQVLYCKVHETDKSGKYLKCTKKRGDFLTGYMKKAKDKLLLNYDVYGEDITLKLDTAIMLVSGTANEKKIQSKQLDDLTMKMIQYNDAFQEKIRLIFSDIMDYMRETYYEDIQIIADKIAEVDVYFNNAYNATQYNLCKPCIDDEETTSYFDAKDMRHILIERIQQQELYVANDLNTRYEDRGVLLFGTNAVGKSSFIKSIGICIIMAQSGSYVPCSSFTYVPYKKLFTRILGNDNIFKHLSTFAVEMVELDIILRHSNENSMILGDELCSGTELGSAISIFASGLKHLDNMNSSFIFATHFHEIVHLSCIQSLSLKHMKVIYDNEKRRLIYDRKLSDGPGNNMYGLEVAKAMQLPFEFIEEAYAIRNELYPEHKSLSMITGSSYNAKKLMHKCEMCGKNAEQVHHLQHQSRSDELGFIGTFHKNHKANLMNVCQSCHHRFHEENRQYRRTKTSDGYILREEVQRLENNI